ncbi:MAG: Tn3 family transposase [Solirubrobacteraceae bacterium]
MPLFWLDPIVVNAIIAWNTVYTGRVLDELRAAGELITTSEIEHISPLAHQHIHLYGHYPVRPRHPTRRPPPAPGTRGDTGSRAQDAEPRLT